MLIKKGVFGCRSLKSELFELMRLIDDPESIRNFRGLPAFSTYIQIYGSCSGFNSLFTVDWCCSRPRQLRENLPPNPLVRHLDYSVACATAWKGCYSSGGMVGYFGHFGYGSFRFVDNYNDYRSSGRCDLDVGHSVGNYCSGGRYRCAAD